MNENKPNKATCEIKSWAKPKKNAKKIIVNRPNRMAIIDIYTRVISGDIVTDPRYIMGKYA